MAGKIETFRKMGSWQRVSIFVFQFDVIAKICIFFIRKSEVIALLTASFLGMPGGCLLFVPFYHPLHDFFKVPTEVTSVSILMVWTAIVWKFDRKSNRYEKPEKMNFISKILFGHLIGHYLINLGTAIFYNPEDVISIGLHQTIGNCNETQPVHTILKVCTIQCSKIYSIMKIIFFSFRHYNVENIFVSIIMMKNITISIACQMERNHKQEVYGTLYVEHHLSKLKIFEFDTFTK